MKRRLVRAALAACIALPIATWLNPPWYVGISIGLAACFLVFGPAR